jgi:hypothetical protein
MGRRIWRRIRRESGIHFRGEHSQRQVSSGCNRSGDTQHHICRFEIIESLENKKIKYRAWEKPKYFGTLSVFTTYSLEPVGTDTKLTCELESEKYGIFGIFGKFFEILYLRRWAKKQMQKELENLKSIVEK